MPVFLVAFTQRPGTAQGCGKGKHCDADGTGCRNAVVQNQIGRSDRDGTEIIADLYWKDCQPKSPSRLAQNEKLARRLWEKSCLLTGIKDYFSGD